MKPTHPIRLLLAGLPVFLLVGCASLPKYEAPPAVALGESWIVPPSPGPEPTDLVAAGPDQLDAWWQLLGDKTLSRLVEKGLAENYDLRITMTRIAEARANLERVAGRRFPTLAARADISERRQSENGPLPVGRIPGLERDQTLHELGVDASWEIDMYGRFGRAMQVAGAKLEATEDEALALRLTVAAEVARTYLSLRGAQHELEAREAAIAALAASLELHRQRVEAGELAENELSSQSVRLLAAQAALPAIHGRIEAAVMALGTLLGGLPEQELSLRETSAGELSLPNIPVGSRADLLRRRPDIRAAERRLAASTAELGLAMAEKFPKLSIGGNGGFQSLELGNLLDIGSLTFAVTPVLTWRIFDGGRVEAEIRASEARLQGAALVYEKSVLTALGDAERAMSEYRSSLESLAAQQRVVEEWRQIHEQNQQRFAAGDIALFEVLEARRQWQEAREAEARLTAQATAALVSTFKSLGGGWPAPATALARNSSAESAAFLDAPLR